ncbi:hypothetical protein THF1C08_10607 [Vibrio jasicida]|uniref:Uncharacterized protein n=1 Tax=Vibrio jasicida TaxID=766224 RepID=A0AAU9QFC2_9VIBR|nr:hypothetical protein THF1C08_10607 [Vibrio jasicida]CAH1567610.1 hypothetical protein THF1A12_10609 [Vibrio jasicida]
MLEATDSQNEHSQAVFTIVFQLTKNPYLVGMASGHTIVYHLRGVPPRHFFTL